jgi:outer membrane protein TolC
MVFNFLSIKNQVKSIIIFCSISAIYIFPFPLFAQPETKALSIEEAMQIAQENSLLSFRATNQYLSAYWGYRSYKASLMPQLGLALTPINYSRAFNQQFDIINEAYVFTETQSLYKSSTLSVSQNVGLTGGTISLSSGLSHLKNINNTKYSAYSASPIQLTYNQPVFGFNEYKWKRELEPLAYQIAEQEYLFTTQQAILNTLNYYFALTLAQLQLNIAQKNLGTCDTLYQLGQKRFEIASIDQEDLLNLKLNKFNAQIGLDQAAKELQKAQFNLNTFLRLGKEIKVVPTMPHANFVLEIPQDEAVSHALENNPDILLWKQKVMNSEMTLDKTVKENRMSASLMASFGLNNSAPTLDSSYNNLANRQLVALSLNIPLIDWGQRKGQRLMALKEKEVVEIEAKQGLAEFEQTVALKVIDYNLQHQLVANTQQAMEIADQSYELAKKRFILGNIDVVRLNAAADARQTSLEKYISALHNLWVLYYEVQQLTLYDFKNQQPIRVNFETLVDK